MEDISTVLARLGAQLHVRGWLSANGVVFAEPHAESTAIVDTGYATHAELTLRLIQRALGKRPLDRIVNTHLHSDHCGGNAPLQGRYPAVRTEVPMGYQPALQPWDPDRLSYIETGQSCAPFDANQYLAPGDMLSLGTRQWEVHAAAGHDPSALMFYEPQDRVLISGDALWERRLAIIFPELTGQEGFGAAARTLDAIERLKPQIVLPGHGEAFSTVSQAIEASRRRLDQFAAHPSQHEVHAARALAMFHMLEVRKQSRCDFVAWMSSTPIFTRIVSRSGQPETAEATQHAEELVQSMLEDRLLVLDNDWLSIADPGD